MNLYQQQFSPDLDLPETATSKTILIASTPRCGSHMVGHAMSHTGLLGVPFEYLNPVNLSEWQKRLGVSGPEATLREISKRRTSGNGVFGLKAHFSHCDILGGPEKLLATFPDLFVVHLRRADVLRQAVSYAIARQTGVWIAGQEGVLDRTVFDEGMIRDCLNDIAVQNARWVSAFERAGVVPLNLYYEEVERDIGSAVTATARHAGVIAADRSITVKPSTKRQSDTGRTDAWVERYAERVLQKPRPRRKFLRAISGARP